MRNIQTGGLDVRIEDFVDKHLKNSRNPNSLDIPCSIIFDLWDFFHKKPIDSDFEFVREDDLQYFDNKENKIPIDDKVRVGIIEIKNEDYTEYDFRRFLIHLLANKKCIPYNKYLKQAKDYIETQCFNMAAGVKF